MRQDEDGTTRLQSATDYLFSHYNLSSPDISLLIFGHRYGCHSCQIISNFEEERDSSEILEFIDNLPVGNNSPIVSSLYSAQSLLGSMPDYDRNIVLITDGIETCGRDFSLAANSLIGEGIGLYIITINPDETIEEYYNEIVEQVPDIQVEELAEIIEEDEPEVQINEETINQEPAQNIANPVISPDGGLFAGSVWVSVSCSTAGVSIRYTTDGTTPSQTHGNLYRGQVNVYHNSLFQAVAYKEGGNTSDVVSAQFSIEEQLSEPVITPRAGTFNGSVVVTITRPHNSSVIRYTTDGSSPSCSRGNIYSGPITITESTTIKAMAYMEGYADSDIAQSHFRIVIPQTEIPVISPAQGNYTGSISITITCRTSGARIFYTTDGTEPSANNGTLYRNAFELTDSANVRAIAIKDGLRPSNIAASIFRIEIPILSTPQFSLEPGNYNEPISISISSETQGCTIRYTTDGSQPSENNGAVYYSPIRIQETTTIKAIALRDGFCTSSINTALYTVTIPVVAAPTFSVRGGVYTQYQQISIQSITPGVAIRYTKDGSEPDSNHGILYNGPITITNTTTLKAVAYRENYQTSSVTTATYTFREPVISSASLTNNPTISYPAIALRMRLEGTVRLNIQVDEEGQVYNVAVNSSSGYDMLDSAATDLAYQMEFTPQTVDGIAVRTNISKTIIFQLNSGTGRIE